MDHHVLLYSTHNGRKVGFGIYSKRQEEYMNVLLLVICFLFLVLLNLFVCAHTCVRVSVCGHTSMCMHICMCVYVHVHIP